MPSSQPNTTGYPGPSVAGRRRGPLAVLERIFLGAATLLLSINLWTGAPLLALWVGSRVANGSTLSMGGIVGALASLVILIVVLLKVLSALSERYDRVTGRPAEPRRPAPWLQSMRGERRELEVRRRHTNAIEVIIILSVVLAVIAFEVWFFFFAGSSLSGSGAFR